MANQKEPNDANKALFASLVTMLSTSALQQLGKLINPLTGKAETNLEAAQVTIDILAMLQERTRGNLDRDEQRMLDDMLASLQMTYVDTAGRKPAEAEKEVSAPGNKEAEEAPADAAPPEGETKPPGDTGRAPPKDPRFHRSYG